MVSLSKLVLFYIIIKTYKVDLLTPYRITGVATQGRLGEQQWVTSFKIACSTDNNIFDTVKDAVDHEADKVRINLSFDIELISDP